MDPKASHMLSHCPVTELHPFPVFVEWGKKSLSFVYSLQYLFLNCEAHSNPVKNKEWEF
jgi:hypothetical protein